MALPPFPCQDLAKLVLGYLDEEDLMTVYDEFLHESPYLDASSNEFDRVVFTSLKTILAEYRAVRIFLSSCKPNLLRRKLKSCPNLVEAFKFLVELADVSKLSHDSLKPRCDDRSYRLQQQTANDTGNSSDLQWSCKSRLSQLSRIEHVQDHSMETSVETASPYDLPGYFGTTKKRRIKTLERERDAHNHEQTPQSYNDMQFNRTSNVHNDRNVGVAEPSVTRLNQGSNINIAGNEQSTSFGGNTPACNVYPDRLCDSNTSSTRDSRRDVAGDTFNNIIVPDVNTPRNTNVPSISAENKVNIITSSTNTAKDTTKPHFQYKHGNIPAKSPFPTTYPGKIKPKTSDQKIMILSDVKVDKQLTDGSAAMTELSRKSSTPAIQMQTILINGTPAFRQCNTSSYTADEIMAMPTFIVVANSSTETATAPTIQTAVPKTNTTMTSANSLGPILIDIANQTENSNKEDSKPPDLTFNKPSDTGILKTVHGKNFSLPKDAAITTDSTDKSTPQVVPPVRKSSSTPRRNSHIRVLDFATPRRILENNIEEQDMKNNEVIVSRSPSLHTFVEAISAGNDKTNSDTQETQNASVGSSKDDNENNNPKKNNWDADLRALAVANNDGFVKTIPICQQRRRKASTKKLNKSGDKKKTPKSKKRKSEEVIDISASPAKDVPDTTVPVKPTINIVTSSDWVIPDTKQTQSEQNKSNEEPQDTPELDRTSLQNVIGSKLNISDLLETPYKQALYDIQMETPRFLDFPGEPPSDIKITSIPTPRFMDTPKPQSTPSYASRATDYSSGGSYYKPDDQDCLALDTLGYLQKVTENSKQSEEKLDEAESKSGVRSRRSSTRPIRKCAKNVTYRNTPPAKKTKERKSSHVSDDKNDTLSSCSDTINSSCELDTQQENKLTQSSKVKWKSDTTSRSRSRKSPPKKQSPKSFMKIKPRRPNASKESARKTKRKTPESRKRTSSKEKSGKVIPVVFKSTNRRKSSTPRKLDSNIIVDSPDHVETDNNPFAQITLDKPIRYPESEVQNDSADNQTKNSSVNESDDISKIKEYIAISETSHTRVVERSLKSDLVNRGFDEETAKIIERDLLDTPRHPGASDVVNEDTAVTSEETKDTEPPLEITLESSVVSNNLQIVQDENEDDDSEFAEWSVHECNEQTSNHTTYSYDETQQTAKGPPITIKENYSMEVCFEDRDVTLKLMQLTSIIDMNPEDMDPAGLEYIDYSYRETETAVNSISNIDKLYTPLKDSIKAACQEIFDSTLTSLDTPLKATSPKYTEHETAVTETVLELEKVDDRGKETKKKRRRISSDASAEETKADTKKIKRGTSASSDESASDNKTKPETPYLLNTENIQKIDIESVLCRLHGP